MLGTRSIVVAAGLVGLVLGTAGCTGATPPAPTETVTATAAVPTATVTASASPTAPASPTPSPSRRVDPAAPAGQCADDDLDVTVQPDPEGGGAGHTDSFVVFRNTGSSACELEGFPGVSIVGGGEGTRLGRAASRTAQASTATVRITPGGSALAELVYSVVTSDGGIYADGNGDDPRCEAAKGDGYRVYPPHSFTAVFVRASVYACTTDVDWIRVQPVVATVKGFTPGF